MSDNVKALIAEARKYPGFQPKDEAEKHPLWLIHMLADALEAAQQAPAVDREALAEAIQHFIPPGGMTRMKQALKVVDAAIASGILQDASVLSREVEARWLEKAADIARAYKSHPKALDQADHIASILVERARRVREGKQ